MAQDIIAVLNALVALEAQLSITAPVPVAVKKVWIYPPPENVLLPDVPCCINSWVFTSGWDNPQGQVRTQRYTVTMQLLARDANFDRAWAIVSAFHPVWIDLLGHNYRLGGACAGMTLRGGTPTVDAATYDKLPHARLTEYVDVRLYDTFDFRG